MDAAYCTPQSIWKEIIARKRPFFDEIGLRYEALWAFEAISVVAIGQAARFFVTNRERSDLFAFRIPFFEIV